MRRLFKKVHENHRELWNPERATSIVWGFMLFGIALIIQRMANNYVFGLKGTAVNDLLLNILPTINIETFIIQEALMITFLGILLCLIQPKYFNFGLKTVSIFMIIRSFFIVLTHLGPNTDLLPLDTSTIGFSLYNIFFNTKGDFFFSAHTGTPFLLALIFWPEKKWRYIFIIASVTMGIGVLLAHMHYSIDVFAAPFMTYSIFIISKKLFYKDYLTSLKQG